MGITINSCCGCFDLKKGSLAIGITELVLSCIGVVLCIVLAALAEPLVRALVDDSELKDVDEIMFLVRVIRAVAIVCIVILVVTIAIGAVMIVGVRRDRHSMILPWIICYGIVFTLSTLSSVSDLFKALIAGNVEEIFIALASLVWDALQWHWFFVVLKHYQNLKAQMDSFRMQQLHEAEPL